MQGRQSEMVFELLLLLTLRFNLMWVLLLLLLMFFMVPWYCSQCSPSGVQVRLIQAKRAVVEAAMLANSG